MLSHRLPCADGLYLAFAQPSHNSTYFLLPLDLSLSEHMYVRMPENERETESVCQRECVCKRERERERRTRESSRRPVVGMVGWKLSIQRNWDQ
jgi:hypothetical protein